MHCLILWSGAATAVNCNSPTPFIHVGYKYEQCKKLRVTYFKFGRDPCFDGLVFASDRLLDLL